MAYDVDGRVIYIGSRVMDAKIFNMLDCADRIRAKMFGFTTWPRNRYSS